MLDNLTKKHKEPLENDLALVLLAAGYSSRMHTFKPLLPLGNSTVIETSIDAFLNAGIKNIIVVIGYKADKLKSLLNRKGVRWVYNEKYKEGMYSSVIAGVKSVAPNVKGIFLLPADIPLIKSEVIQKLAYTFLKHKPIIVYPVFMGRCGHPPIVSSCLFPHILAYDGTGGLKAILAKYKKQAHYIEIEDEGILMDMDTYDEYLKVCNKLRLSSENVFTSFEQAYSY